MNDDTLFLAHEVLHCPMEPNNANAATVGEYLGLLLSNLWIDGERFSSKRPFGDSDWQYDVYIALNKAGLIKGLILDEDGYVKEFNQKNSIKADELILEAIKLAYDHG